ncbi:MAG: prepilin peptidase [Candidatus Riflebacteria bacterium]|nr:prepilin peptidase [Candidatus Riflebacteria bacterium]
MNIETAFFLPVFFVFGSLLGSFCNVVILRMGEGRSVVFPPSECPACNHRLSPLDLIPIFGWLLLRGKCRYCSVSISIQYPIIETVIAVLTAGSFYLRGFTASFVALSAWCIFITVLFVLFIRNKVKTVQPYLVPVVYFLALSYLSHRQIDFYHLITSLSATIAAVALLKLNRNMDISYLGCFAFCSCVLLSGKYLFPNALVLVCLSFIPLLKKDNNKEIYVKILLGIWAVSSLYYNFHSNSFFF